MHHLTSIGLSIAFTGLLGCQGGASDGADAGAPESSPSTDAQMGEAEAETSADAAGDAQVATPAAEGDWSDGDTIPSGMEDVPDIQILKVHSNGTGEVCGSGKSATLAYKAMLADGTVIDPGSRPFTFKVGARQAIVGWDVVVALMRVGDSFTITLPQQLAYGPSRGDLKFDMELLSFE